MRSVHALIKLGRRVLCAGLTGAALASPAGHAAGGLPVRFTPTEMEAIATLGPWPPATAQDLGNAQSGRRAAIALGQKLFFDPRLSRDGSMSCATCHTPGLAFTDARPRSMGRQLLDRNAPSLWNGVHARWQGWDGAADSLWSQALRPLLEPREMASNAQAVARLLRTDPDLACRYRQAFGREPGADSEATLVDAGKALGAFTATLVSGRTPFDAFRDQLLRQSSARPVPVKTKEYPVAAQRGLQLFVGRGQCVVCHVGPLLSNGEFADIGLPFFVRPGVVDPGRHEGIVQLRASAYNLNSRWSDAQDPSTALKTRQVELQHRNFGEFKVPSLRNVALTAPYMHDGQLASLQAVVQHYSTLNLERLHADGEQILRPLHLSPAEVDDLAAFLQTLTDPRARRWQPQRLPPCREPPGKTSLKSAPP